MKFDENFDYDKFEINIIEEKDVPNIISSQFENLKCIDLKIQEAQLKCEEARKNCDEMKKVKVLLDTKAVNSVQTTIRSIVETQEAFALSQKLLFENQQKMAQGMRYLLILGTYNISMGRLVVKTLEEKLKYASKDEISRKTRDEVIQIIKLLKEQENAFSKQDRLEEFLDSTYDIVDSHSRKILSIEMINEEQSKKDIEHDLRIEENKNINDLQEKYLEELKEVDIRHNKQIKKASKFSIFAFIFALVNMGLVFLGIILGIIGIIV